MTNLCRLLLWLSNALILFIAMGVGLCWVPDRNVDSLKARWAQHPSMFVELQNMTIHIRDEGWRDDPEPIVLIHGTSASLHTWDEWTFFLLHNRRRVVRMDLPGFGLTGPDPNGDYSLARYADFVTGLMDHLNIPQALLAGNSLGGNIAWTTALAYPERVSRLILVDSAGYKLTSTSIPIAFRLAQISWLRPVLSKVLPRSMVETSVRNVYANPDKVTSALVDRYYELALRAGNRASLFDRLKLRDMEWQNSHQIRRIQQPTLILWGAQDELILESLGRRFHGDIAGSTYVVFEGLGHVPHEEDPQRSVQPVLQFLSTGSVSH